MYDKIRFALGWPAALTIVLLGTACGTESMGPAAYYSQRAQSFCSWLVRCPTTYLRYATVEECVRAGGTETLRNHSTAVSAAISRGTLLFDGDLAQRCLDWVASAPCEQDSAYVMYVAHPECSAVFQGLVADGGICYVDEECDYGRCGSGDSYGCPGQCEGYPRLGEPCDPYTYEAACGPGLECNADVCLPQEPVVFAGLGESCAGSTGHSCAPGLRCDYYGTESVCVALLPIGSSCSSDNDCEVGLDCIRGTSDSVCQRVVLVTREGDACGGTRVCDHSRGLSCDPYLGWCTGLPSLGQPCPEGECRDGLFCNETMSPVCQNLLPDGSPCEMSYYCRSGSCSAAGLCQPAGLCA